MAKKKCGCKRKRGGASHMGAASTMGAGRKKPNYAKRLRARKGGMPKFIKKAARGVARGVTSAYKHRGKLTKAASFVGKNYKKAMPAIKKAVGKSKQAIKAAQQEYSALKQILPKR